VTKPVGRLTYTQLLNTRGGIEADLTVARLADDRFYIVTGTGFRTHDLAWIREHIPQGADAGLRISPKTMGHAFADGAACP
jgi:sarcosine dehydrogenase